MKITPLTNNIIEALFRVARNDPELWKKVNCKNTHGLDYTIHYDKLYWTILRDLEERNHYSFDPMMDRHTIFRVFWHFHETITKAIENKARRRFY